MSLLVLCIVGTLLTFTNRHFHPKQEGAFTFWTNRQPSARSNNAGWRLDYFLVTPNLLPFIKSSEIRNNVPGAEYVLQHRHHSQRAIEHGNLVSPRVKR